MYRGFGNMLSNMLIVWIIQIILISIIGIPIYMIGKNKKGNGKTGSNAALEILNKRFAKGEIDEEYKKNKKNLSGFK